jgi:hypothetical protein
MIMAPALAFVSIVAAANTVNIYRESATTTADPNGSWNFVDASLSDSIRSFTAMDMAGNTSAALRPVNGTVVPPIASFSATPNDVFDIGGAPYRVETAGQSYSLTKPDAQTLRFEIQPGDHAWFDSGSVDRAEVDGSAGGYIPTGTPVDIRYQFMVEPNGSNGSFTNTARWFVTAEIHNADKISGVSTSPPFAIQLAGDHLQVVARYCPTDLDPSNDAGKLTMLTLWTDPNPLQTGQYYNIQIQANVSNTSSGYLDVWVNGIQVVNYHGPLGYGAPTYWEEGLYRNAGPAETVAASFRDLIITIGSTPP